MPWRDSLRPASFRGVRFHVAVNTANGGRRGITYEYPKRDVPDDEDMGRRARRRTVSGYVIGSEYDLNADDLERALDAPGSGLLILPIQGQGLYRCETWTRAERKEEGGFAVFDMSFVIGNAPGFQRFDSDTQRPVQMQADAAAEQTDISVGKDSDWVG